MFGKLLLTAAVLLGVYLALRTRRRRGREVAEPPAPSREPGIPAEILKAVAYGLVVLMAVGSLLWLYLDWDAEREVVSIQIINSGTGETTAYRARRGDVTGRRFTTLDGRTVTLAEVERMVLGEER